MHAAAVMDSVFAGGGYVCVCVCVFAFMCVFAFVCVCQLPRMKVSLADDMFEVSSILMIAI